MTTAVREKPVDAADRDPRVTFPQRVALASIVAKVLAAPLPWDLKLEPRYHMDKVEPTETHPYMVVRFTGTSNDCDGFVCIEPDGSGTWFGIGTWGEDFPRDSAHEVPTEFIAAMMALSLPDVDYADANIPSHARSLAMTLVGAGHDPGKVQRWFYEAIRALADLPLINARDRMDTSPADSGTRRSPR